MTNKPSLSLLTLSILAACAQAADLPSPEEMATLVVKGTRISDVSGRYVKSADLADGLFRNQADIFLVRRSGIANDVILRGLKKDNINVLIDGGKIYGACPNRMDPPTSHVLNNNVESVEINEGPYDVENFGTLGGSVSITTRAPEPGFHGNIDLNLGAWNYRKGAAAFSGGNDSVQALVSFSHEESDQYEDGKGHTLAEQLIDQGAPAMNRYRPDEADHKAYKKRTFLGKLSFDPTANQHLELGYTANRSEDVLYPNSPMDALEDDSDLFNLSYTLTDLGAWSRELEVKLYDSRVWHPMSTRYRMAGGPDGVNERQNRMKSRISGLRVRNRMGLAGGDLAFGLDTSRRNWDGEYRGSGMNAGITGIASIADVDTDNIGLFAEYDKDLGRLALRLGARWDHTRIEPGTSALPDNDYDALNAFVFGTWGLSDDLRLFGGLGVAHRVPDARELYFRTAPMMGMPSMLAGTPDLDQVRNTELDLGAELDREGLYLKAKLFHSWLGNFIFYNATRGMHRFENQDARLYGLSLDGNLDLGPTLTLEFGVAWQRGKKEDPLSGQQGTDMPEIPPLKGNLALGWRYHDKGLFRAELIAADAWSDYDAENGEQALPGWAVVNLSLRHQFGDHLVLLGGVDNLFDRTYAVSNTYKDMTLIADGTGDVMLLNEPGRYWYANLSWRF